MATAQPVMPPGWRVPFFWIRIDGSQAGTPRTELRTLIMAPMLAAGTAAPDTPVTIGPAEDAAVAFGTGSIAHRMAVAYRLNDPYGNLVMVGLADTGTKSAGDVTFGGVATEDGEISLYIAGQRVPIPVADTDTGTDMALTAQAEINAVDDMPVTAGAPTAGLLPLTAKNGGEQGDDIDIRINYQASIDGNISGEKLPAGTTFSVTTAMTGGATPPSLTTALANLGDEPYDHVIHPWTDTTTLDVIKAWLDDVTGRWSPEKQVYGHAYYAYRGTVATLGTFGNARNWEHETAFGFYGSPTPQWEWSAAHVGQCAPELNQLPTIPVWGLKVNGVLAPPVGSGRFEATERNVLYYDGISVSIVGADGAVYTEQVLTTYQKLPSGASDDAWLKVNTPHTATAVARRLKNHVLREFSRRVLVDPGTPTNADVPATDVNEIRASLIGHYSGVLVRAGLCENANEFAANLVVQRDSDNQGGDPNRVNVIPYAPDFANQLDVFDTNMQFRLQYPPASASGAAT